MPLRVGVVGMGVMGRRHLLALATCPTAQVVAVHDHTPGHAPGGVPFAATLPELLDLDLDAVVVATPAMTHRTVVEACLNAGEHVLVEKPLAATPEDAAALRELAESRSLLLAVGHVERFSTALTPTALTHLAVLAGTRITTVRTGDPPVRVTDVGALLDAAVHDVDLVRFLTRREYVGADVNVIECSADGRESAATVAAVLDDGTPVAHEVAWTPGGTRRLLAFTPTVGALRTVDLATPPGPASLRAQAAAFVAACTGVPDERLASALDGLRAVEVVTGALPRLSRSVRSRSP